MLRNLFSMAAVGGMILLPGLSWAQPAAQQTPAAAPGAEAADPFAVPAGTDSQTLVLFLQRLASTPPAVQTPEGVRDHLTKIDRSLAEILSRPVDEEFYAQAAELRLSVLSVLGQVGDINAAAKFQKFLDQLKQDKRPGIQKLASRVEFSSRLARLPEMTSDERLKVVAELTDMLKTAPKEDGDALNFAVRSAMETAQSLEQIDAPVALAAYKSFLAALQSRNDERFASLITVMEPAVRRLSLPGQAIEISGTTLDGEKFDIKQYAGKVVLVDFWATWCGPCLAELPHVKEMYEGYHEKGFEVVGISLDEEKKETLEQFLDDRDIEWINLFDPNPEKQGWNNPIVRYYGITGIPTAILVDQKGLVVSLNARGQELTSQLAKLLGEPLKDSDAAPAVGSPLNLKRTAP